MLRKRDPEVSNVLYTVYKMVPEMEYFLRWQIVETLKELGNKAAYGPLSSIVTSRIPPERFESKEHFSQDYEIMIRSNALEGLAVYSEHKVKGADDILLKMAKHKNITLRRSAIRSYLKGASNKKEMSERSDALKRMLDKKDLSLVTLRVTEVREVPHPEEVTTRFERSKIKRDDQMQKGEDGAPKVER
ncbi:MAG TPA: hypothetical protein ENG83_00505 [Nitrospirae bacterium]|nr:hypothetical protein BMS3Abin06_01947 [bacterium BMS3Abin06]HDH10684.1 hypothetical protein [Nitrospirota bacterium]HDL19822.1 hypothetical protein [Nitrospirota bacterium]HDZ02536.1 hypothetical protein [Nitrospirota bacterium]